MQIFAGVISYIFHPLFIPTYFFVWLVFRFPIEFEGLSRDMLRMRLISTFWTTAFFPAFSVFLLWKLKFIDSILLRTKKDRIIPYIISMIFYWWMWYLSRHFTDQPVVLKMFYMGIVIATTAGLIINNFIKISMHAMGVAGVFTCIIFSCIMYQPVLIADIVIVATITGVVCFARLLLKEHSNAEVYVGLIIGALCQVIAGWITL